METAYSRKVLGADSSRKLRARLSELEVADSVLELVAGRPHPYRGRDKEKFSLDLAKGKRLLFVPTQSISRKNDGGIDWDKIDEITIVYLGDIHNE